MINRERLENDAFLADVALLALNPWVAHLKNSEGNPMTDARKNEVKNELLDILDDVYENASKTWRDLHKSWMENKDTKGTKDMMKTCDRIMKIHEILHDESIEKDLFN